MLLIPNTKREKKYITTSQNSKTREKKVNYKFKVSLTNGIVMKNLSDIYSLELPLSLELQTM